MPRLKRVLLFLVCLGLLGAAAAEALAQFADRFWLLELITHFRLHILAGGALLLLLHLALAGVRTPFFWIGFAGAAVTAWEVYPYIGPAPPQAPIAVAADAPRLRILSSNLHYPDNDLDATRRMLEEAQADIVVLTEIAPRHAPVLEAVRPILPFGTEFPKSTRNGRISWQDLMLLSREPPESVVVDHTFGAAYPIMTARFCRPGARCLSVIATHPVPPKGLHPDHGRPLRDAVLERTVDTAIVRKAAGDSLVVLGDFNVTPFSPVFRPFVERAGLKDTAVMRAADGSRGWWLYAPPTWPRFLGPFGIVIDHVLVHDVVLLRRRLGPDIGSDHLPIVVDIALPPPR